MSGLHLASPDRPSPNSALDTLPRQGQKSPMTILTREHPMAKTGSLDARLARLEEQIRQAKEAQRAINHRKRALFREDEKRRVWIVGQAAMIAMKDARVRTMIAHELARDGMLRREGDAELFADLLAGTYVPTAAETEARQAMTLDEPADTDQPVTLAAAE
jgi:hypothetical protein